jgi:hypothetical protein
MPEAFMEEEAGIGHETRDRSHRRSGQKLAVIEAMAMAGIQIEAKSIRAPIVATRLAAIEAKRIEAASLTAIETKMRLLSMWVKHIDSTGPSALDIPLAVHLLISRGIEVLTIHHS